ncbi:MAG: hypothetical protein Q4F06_09810 [Eubacteriales bacterium]|nr:hypothetical protein [Eubacteriales bacterium]
MVSSVQVVHVTPKTGRDKSKDTYEGKQKRPRIFDDYFDEAVEQLDTPKATDIHNTTYGPDSLINTFNYHSRIYNI